MRWAPIEDRFWSSVLIVPFLECWEWIGPKNEKGYGKISEGSPPRKTDHRAHRLSWVIHYGKIHQGLVICHKCDNPGCVNPSHLFMGTKKDNSKDMISKGRGKGHFSDRSDSRMANGKHNLIKINCPNGHPYSGENLKVYKGRRHCRTCINLRAKRRRAKCKK